VGRRRSTSRTRVRFDRVALAGTSLTVTTVAVLAGVGVIPDVSAAASGQTSGRPVAAAGPSGYPSASPPDGAAISLSGSATTRPQVGREAQPEPGSAASAGLPADSGTGRRVVFSEALQRVWLVRADGDVRRTYLVSGSLTDNLRPGTYDVWSRSEQAWGIDDSGTMRWFVRFAHGERAAIGFHDIPVDEGRKVQSVDDLGTPQSHGCIRQRPRDAREMWAFAQLGTTVVVV
jgi:hypothetical protein